MKRVLGFFLFIMLIAASASATVLTTEGVSAGYLSFTGIEAYRAVVLCESLSVCDERNGTVIDTLYFGDTFMTSESWDGWANCTYADGSKSGWVRSDYIVIDPAYYLTDSQTAVYAYGDTMAPRVALLDGGAKLPIMPMKLTADTTITDDPWGSKRVLAQLAEGTEVICLCSWDSAYAYVETRIEGKIARGFVPMDTLAVEQPPVDQHAAMMLAGTRWMSSDGDSNMLGNTVVFERGGRITAESQDRSLFGESCTWKVTVYDPQWGLFWDDPQSMLILTMDDGSIECYGLTLGKGYLRLSTSEGSGGYGQALDESEQTREPRIIVPDSPKTSMDSLSGQKFLVGGGDYSPETKEIALSLWVPEAFATETVEGLEVGDIVVIGGHEYKIQAILIDEDGCRINELAWLEDETVYMQKEADGRYYPINVHDRVWQRIGEDSFRFAKNAVFLDGINPDTGLRLEKPTVHTIDEFLKMKNYAEEIEYDSFFIRNMWATFDDHDEITVIERQYVPWQ